jgi:hypothetical protein
MFETQGAANSSNTWMFDGGSTTVGSVTEIGGIRNYAYQFEEYVRGMKMNALSDGWGSRQRFVVIVGQAGQTLADSLAASMTAPPPWTPEPPSTSSARRTTPPVPRASKPLRQTCSPTSPGPWP